jgi:hypothetical protein
MERARDRKKGFFLGQIELVKDERTRPINRSVYVAITISILVDPMRMKVVAMAKTGERK